jgi:hypothetical protein
MTVDKGASIQELNDLALGAAEADITMEDSSVAPNQLGEEPHSPDPV